MRNKFAEMSHKFCSSGLNLSAAKLSEIEQQRFDTCLKKYGQAFNIYKEEHQVYLSDFAAVKEQGGDPFAKFNNYDKYWIIKNVLAEFSHRKISGVQKRKKHMFIS